MSSNEWNTSINLPNRKLIFSKYVSFLALLNIIQDLKCSGSSPTGDSVKTINHSCTFSFFLRISVALSFPSSSSLTIPLSSRVYQQGTKRSKNHARGISGLTGSTCISIPPFSPARKWADLRVCASSEVFLTHQRARYLSHKASNIPHLWEGGAPLASCIRRSFGPNWHAIEFVSPFSRVAPNLEKGRV